MLKKKFADFFKWMHCYLKSFMGLPRNKHIWSCMGSIIAVISVLDRFFPLFEVKKETIKPFKANIINWFLRFQEIFLFLLPFFSVRNIYPSFRVGNSPSFKFLLLE